MTGRQRRRWLIGATALGALGLGAGFGMWRFRLHTAHDSAVDLVFSMQYPDSEGAVQDMSQWRGQVVVLNFWATWCAPCVEEMPELSDMQTELRPKGVQIVGLAVDSMPRVQAFGKRLPVDYPLLITNASGAELARALGNESGALPYTVVIDRQGRIVNRKLGRFDRVELTGHIESALQG